MTPARTSGPSWLPGTNVLNAGVDINGYQPVTFDELLENNRVFKSGC